MKAQNNSPVTFLSWDTEFFGFRIARIQPARLSPAEMKSALSWCRENTIRCVYFQADAGDSATVQLAEQNGFSLVDVRVELEKPADAGAVSQGVTIRDAAPDDLPALKKLFAGISHFSRFAFDRRFPADAAERLYTRWIERSLEGYADFTLVAEDDGSVAGGITGHFGDGKKTAQIGLLAVSENSRSKGLGRLLVQAFCRRAAEQGAATVDVATQGRNVAALRFYNRNGFVVKSVLLSYHKWLES